MHWSESMFVCFPAPGFWALEEIPMLSKIKRMVAILLVVCIFTVLTVSMAIFQNVERLTHWAKGRSEKLNRPI